MAQDYTLNTQAFSYADFTPLDGKPVSQQTLDSIKQGDIGKITGLSFDTGALVVSTDKGTFKFHGPAADLKPGDSTSLRDTTGTSDRLGGQDMSGVSTIYDIMTLLHALSREQKAGAREARQAAADAQNAKLMEAAEDIRNGAIIALVCGVVSGAVSIGAAGFQGFGAVKGLNALKGAKAEINVMTDASKMGDTQKFDMSKASMADKSTYAQNIGMKFSAIGQGLTGFGQIINSAGQFGNSMFQAEQKEDEADAQQLGALGEREGDFVQAMKDAQQKILEILGSIEAANNESTKSILRA